ncbi:Asp23/Gls24 family envelope stress response protein [Streptomyces aureus]|uniref:Asp23/Gls24 family envelope stress response protein n=1 Tax=Streptomyces aureus TaxID=193461 RepID=UPI0005664BF0|nr:Asp23/Gls24 family envelope stress response protein [Streptomyces aureus]
MPDHPEPPGAPRPALVTVPPPERGATRIADRVVAKIASRAAREALPPPPADAVPPHASVVVRRQASGTGGTDGTPTHSARVRVSLELGYPADIGAQCGAVRRHVTERVEALAGMEVPEVAVQVERLHLTPESGAVRGRTQ